MRQIEVLRTYTVIFPVFAVLLAGVLLAVWHRPLIHWINSYRGSNPSVMVAGAPPIVVSRSHPTPAANPSPTPDSLPESLSTEDVADSLKTGIPAYGECWAKSSAPSAKVDVTVDIAKSGRLKIVKFDHFDINDDAFLECLTVAINKISFHPFSGADSSFDESLIFQ